MLNLVFLALNFLYMGSSFSLTRVRPSGVQRAAAERMLNRIEYFDALWSEGTQDRGEEEETSLEELSKGRIHGGSEDDYTPVTACVADRVGLPTHACSCDPLDHVDDELRDLYTHPEEDRKSVV